MAESINRRSFRQFSLYISCQFFCTLFQERKILFPVCQKRPDIRERFFHQLAHINGRPGYLKLLPVGYIVYPGKHTPQITGAALFIIRRAVRSLREQHGITNSFRRIQLPNIILLPSRHAFHLNRRSRLNPILNQYIKDVHFFFIILFYMKSG